METRSQARLKRSEPDKFEKTVNLLLTRVRNCFKMKLTVEKPFLDPDSGDKLPEINVKKRADNKQSRPDAELIGSDLYIVIDAKFYQG